MSFEDDITRRIEQQNDTERANEEALARDSREAQMHTEHIERIALELGRRAAAVLENHQIQPVPWYEQEVVGTYISTESGKSGYYAIERDKYEYVRRGEGWFIYRQVNFYDEVKQVGEDTLFALRSDGIIARFMYGSTFWDEPSDRLTGIIHAQHLRGEELLGFVESDGLKDCVASLIRKNEPFIGENREH